VHGVDAVDDVLFLVRDPDRPVRAAAPCPSVRPTWRRESTFPLAGSTCSRSESVAWIQGSGVPATNQAGRAVPTGTRVTPAVRGSTRAIALSSRPNPTQIEPRRAARPAGHRPTSMTPHDRERRRVDRLQRPVLPRRHPHPPGRDDHEFRLVPDSDGPDAERPGSTPSRESVL
jgi:hypothetical protein